jgi:hypothetical protein
MFYFIRKDELFDRERLHYRLAVFAKALPTGQVLQRFVSTVEDALTTASARVFATVHALSISDYAYLKMLRLSEDGQPLGEYLLWLIAAQLVNETVAQHGVTGVEAEANALKFDSLPPAQTAPSAHLATLYSSAVMRSVDGLPAAPPATSAYLQFGDLFRRDNSKQVWLCLTPACDLAYSDTRPLRGSHSVLLLPGELIAIHEPLKPFQQRQPRTELVRINNESFRILWNLKTYVQLRYGDLQKWQTERQVLRVYRLHPAYALEVQRAFAADLTRIGMPVPPPFYQVRRVRLNLVDAKGGSTELTAGTEYTAILVAGERGDLCILGESFMDELPRMLETGEKALRDNGQPELTSQADVIAAVRSDADKLIRLRGPWPVPSPGTVGAMLDKVVALVNGSAAVVTETPLHLHLEIADSSEEGANASDDE